MRDAITHLNNDPVALASPEESVPDRQVILQGTHLRDVLLRSFAPAEEDRHAHTPLQDADDEAYVAHETLDHASRLGGNTFGVFSQDMHIHSWAMRHSMMPPIKMDGDPVLEGFNETQVRAIALMIRERMSLVQGVSFFFSLVVCMIVINKCPSASWDWKDKDNCRNNQASQGKVGQLFIYSCSHVIFCY
jgi:hypothetical protein